MKEHEDSKNIRNVFIWIMFGGLFIFLLGLVLSVKMLFLDVRGKESTYATITKIANNTTTVEYKANGRVVKRSYTLTSSSYYVGKKVKVYYNKLNPYKSFIAGIRYLILIVPGIGILTMGISGLGFIYIYMKYYNKF